MSSNVRGVRNAVCLIAGVASVTVSGCSYRKGVNRPKSLQIVRCIPKPLENSNVVLPAGYNGPVFQLSHEYPAAPLPRLADQPWRDAIHGGTINPGNAGDYVEALKKYIAPAMRKMLMDPDHWSAAAEGWYNEPWLSCDREPIHGMYIGTESFPVDQFPGTGLKAPFSTYVLTYYDRRAANTLYNVWGSDAKNPIFPLNAQFANASIVVKAAFVTANASKWSAMAGALQWPLYITTNATTGNHAKPQIDQTSLMQFDIIIKDTASAPRTGWVFSTLVYDASIKTGDVWDKMVPLGAMWGNDPEVNSSLPNHGPLKETWINPAAPEYAKKTLGWGGRLSGPNDGALNDAVIPPAITKSKNLASSSCMACHISAEWPEKSFLLPTPAYPPKSIGPNGDYLVMWAPGSPPPGWMRWFQSPRGTQPMDPGTTATDYDMVFAFKTLPAWALATTPNPSQVIVNRKGQRLGYNGKPISN